MANSVIRIAIPFLLVFSFSALSALIRPSANFGNYTRSCPAVAANPVQYLADWGDAISSTMGIAKESLTLSDACIFNGNLQGRIYNSDGTPQFTGSGSPNGVDFSIHAPGSLVTDNSTFSYIDVGGNLVFHNSLSDKHQAQVTFKDQTQGTSNLLMPEIKLATYTAEGERNSTNVSAWSGFQRIAGTDNIDLELVIDFDFFNSDADHLAGLWEAPGIPGIHDYILYLGFGAAKSIENEENVFPTFTDQFAFEGFSSRDEIFGQYTEQNPYIGQIILDLSGISVGETVYIYGNAQAFGFNGGFADAFNTVKTKLQVANVSEEESLRILSTQFALATTSSIPEPVGIGFLGLALAMLFSRRHNARR